MKFKKSDVGRYCESFWDDTGVVSGIIVEFIDPTEVKVFPFRGEEPCRVSNTQEIKLGRYLNAKDLR